MSRDDAKKILGEGATEEQITNLLNNYHVQESAKAKELQEENARLKAENSKYGDYDNIKKQLDDINKANMSEQEKLEAQKKEIEKNLRESRITVARAKAKEILAGESLTDEQIEDLVSDDLDATISRANRWKDTINAIKDTTVKATTESLTKIDLAPTMSNVNQNDVGMTRDKFFDLSAEEQQKFMSEHPTEYQNLK